MNSDRPKTRILGIIHCSLIAVIALGIGCSTVPSDPAPPQLHPPRGHAHNDYEHELPLLDALEHGFSSVEADIHLVDNQLLVAHDADEVSVDRTLQGLYLDPLRERFRALNGSLTPTGAPFILLVDIKTEAESTYQALRTVLEDYQGMLTTYVEGHVLPGAVSVILSGNRPTETVGALTTRRVSIDGRLPNLESSDTYPVSLVPLISDNWKSHFRWRGEGPMPSSELRKLQQLVARAHQQGRILRFWGNPDMDSYWSLAHASGVDLINTDRLPELAAFLNSVVPSP